MTLRLLLVEDNPADVRLLGEAFAEAGVSGVTLKHCADGERALQRLRGSEQLVDAVVLDLNMPLLDGREFLRTLRADPNLCELPVVVLTTSHYEDDVKECRALSVRGYALKPNDFEEMIQVARRVVALCRESTA